ncbi:MAG: hypothetical protein RI907_1203 [Pseudomonadota bacterium]|jgi:signal transduction histidine kinase/ActR/RegA family two-component response regulator
MGEEVAARVKAAQLRALHELIPVAMATSIVATVALYVILRTRVDVTDLQAWAVLRVLIASARMAVSVLVLRGAWLNEVSSTRALMTLTVIDGISWGAMGWWLTPVTRLDVAVVTLSVGIGVGSMGVMGTYMYRPAALAFVAPNLLPNAIYSLNRHDDLGVFSCLALAGLTLIWLDESVRSNRRTRELLRLRFESEESELAKSQALRQARELAETRSRFVAIMSHEMRTPLHGILGLMRLVREDTTHPRSARHLELMQGSGEHLLNVINEVLEYSKLETTGLPVHAQAFRLDALLDDLVDTMRVTCEDKGLALQLDSTLPPDAWVHGDATRIRQVLSNLLGNAVKFTKQGGVTIRATRSAETGLVRLAVRDTGVGIPEHELERVFEPFHQAEGTYQRRFGGTGLGLTISRELCVAMGGSLTCTSQEGQGSEFVCELPLPALQPSGPAPSVVSLSQPAAPTKVGRPGLTHHVLLVDDNPVNTLVAEAELRRLGMQVTSVDSGAAALAWLSRQRPDLILMDCEMPEMDGIEATRQIRAAERQEGRSAVPIVALTANGLDTFNERCVPAGMNDFLSKPFEREDLCSVLKRQLKLEHLGEVEGELAPG